MNSKHTQRVIQLASVASMIDLFNKENIAIMEGLGYQVDVAANFQEGSITSSQRVAEYRRELNLRNINVYDIPIPRSIFKISQIVKSYKKLKQLADNNFYKIVHVHSPIGGVIGRLAFRDARKHGTKVIYTAHGFHFFNGALWINWLLYYPIERLCSKITDILITINQEDYNRAKKWKTCKVKYVPGIGVDTRAFQEDHGDRKKLREEFGFNDQDFVLMSTGQISVRKNHEVIIRALQKVENKKVKYLIVGFGELEEKLKKLAKELEVDERIVFAGYRADVKSLLHAVDAFVFPSLQEGLPVSLMEAMAAGLPIICSRIRGNVDLVIAGKGGYIYDCHDVEGFTEGINKILINNKTNKMGLFNVDRIKEFDKTIVNQYMTKIYQSG